MGFMDRAKKMAEQAQAKIDEVQKGFNEKQGSGGGGEPGAPAVEYDKHGRPLPTSGEGPDPTPTSGEGSDPGPAPAPAEPAKAEGDPLLSDEPGSRQGADAEREAKRPSGGAPGMTSGDPLG